MPKIAKPLTDLAVRRLKPGTHAVGEVPGLLIHVRESGRKNWVLRIHVGGRRTEFGLGTYPAVSLEEAREKARKDRKAVREENRNPALDRRQARAALAAQAAAEAEAAKPKLTVEEAIDKAYAAHSGRFATEKNGRRWLGTLKTHISPVLGTRPLESITDEDILGILKPLWIEQNDVAQKVRSRFAQVFDHAVEEKEIPEIPNPALFSRLRSRLKKLGTPARGDHQPAVQWQQAPEFYRALVGMPGTAALALRFLMLVACRSAEVTDMTHPEVDLDHADGPLLIVPADRTKTGKTTGRKHLVPLSKQAVELIEASPKMVGSPFVFPSPRGLAFSNMAMSQVMRRMHAAITAKGGTGFLDAESGRPAVPHGLRSSFRSWASATRVPWEVAEMILGHEVGGKVERAYNREELIPERRVALQSWADYVVGASPKSSD